MAEVGLREREIILEFNQAVTGLRMNNAWIRPGGVATDLPETGLDQLRDLIKRMEKYLPEIGQFCNENPIFKARTQGIGYADLSTCMALGVTGPALRATGLPWDLRKTQPIAITTRMTSTSPLGIPATVTGVSASAWKRWTSRCAFSSNASSALRTPRVTVIWSRTRTSRGRLNWLWARWSG